MRTVFGTTAPSNPDHGDAALDGAIDDPIAAGRHRVVIARARRHAGRAMTWAVVVAGVAVAVVASAVAFGPDDRLVQGDEASYVLSALSLRDGDLSYDAVDQARWDELGFRDPTPTGLYLQSFSGGYAVAKPIGYSIMLSPFLWLFGLSGIRYAGLLLLFAYGSCWYFLGVLRWSRSAAFLVAVVASVASHAWYFAFPAMADLFVASLVGIVAVGCSRSVLVGQRFWLLAAAAGAGLLVTEKIPALLAMSPILAVAVTYASWRMRAASIAAFVVVAVISVAPFLYYSDGTSWSPYGGVRYYAQSATPFNGGTIDDLQRISTDEKLSLPFVAERLTSPSVDMARSTSTYVVGRHTGALTFLPIAPILTAISVAVLLRHRRARRRTARDADPRRNDAPDDVLGRSPATIEGVVDEGSCRATATEADNSIANTAAVEAVTSGSAQAGRPDGSVAVEAVVSGRPAVLLAWAGITALGLYVAFYVVLFTHNYYGGSQTIGNRYFLQFSVVAVVAPVAIGVSQRAVLSGAALACAWALIVLGPHMSRGHAMLNEYYRVTSTQQLLPYDSTQLHALGFWSGPPDEAWNLRTREWTGAEMWSRTGIVVGGSRLARGGVDPAGALAFGPYEMLADHRYVVTFRYASSAPHGEAVGSMEVALVGVPTATTSLAGTGDVVVTRSVEFEADADFGWEYRFLWDGQEDFELISVRVEAHGP
jgi:hypothetical protein